jgi:hypothetical protein
MAVNLADLPFDPVRVRLKIHELRKNLLGLETLLETYGLKADGLKADGPQQGPPAAPPLTESQRPRQTTRRRSRRIAAARRAATRANVKARKPKLADLAVEVISKHGGRAHGKIIVEELRLAGHMLDVAHPDSNISTALSRDSRVERAPDARNTWVLKAA